MRGQQLSRLDDLIATIVSLVRLWLILSITFEYQTDFKYQTDLNIKALNIKQIFRDEI